MLPPKLLLKTRILNSAIRSNSVADRIDNKSVESARENTIAQLEELLGDKIDPDGKRIVELDLHQLPIVNPNFRYAYVPVERTPDRVGEDQMILSRWFRDYHQLVSGLIVPEYGKHNTATRFRPKNSVLVPAQFNEEFLQF